MSRSPTDSLPEFDERHKETTFSRLQNTLVTGVKSPYHELSCCFPYGKYQRLLALSIPVLDNHREITHIMSVIHHITCREAGAKGGASEDEMGRICQRTF